MMFDINIFEELFLQRLTKDSETKDARKREFNQAIFDSDEGFACYTGTDLSMVMDKFELAVRDYTLQINLKGGLINAQHKRTNNN